jgi:hypothetical protein
MKLICVALLGCILTVAAFDAAWILLLGWDSWNRIGWIAMCPVAIVIGVVWVEILL